MPYKQPKIEKLYYSVGEVAELIGENTSLIRYWENQFEALKPFKNKKGNRMFSPEDIEQIKLIHFLVKQRGLTIKGAKQKLRDNKNETIANYEIVVKLQSVKNELLEILNELEDENE